MENFKSIEFRPEQFNEYLLSREIGFSQSELIGTPANPSKGIFKLYCCNQMVIILISLEYRVSSTDICVHKIWCLY